MIIALGLASRRYAALWGHNSRFSMFDFAEVVISRTGFYSIAAAWLYIALFLTGSRGGITAGIIGCILVLFWRTFKVGRMNVSFIGAILGGLAITLALSVNVLESR